MARSAVILDPFVALADPKRRRMLESIGTGERPVNDLVGTLGWPQPMISKHLAVLKQVGLVTMRQDGRRRLYRVNGDALKPVHDWVKGFEQFWSESFDRLDVYLREMQEKEKAHDDDK